VGTEGFLTNLVPGSFVRSLWIVTSSVRSAFNLACFLSSALIYLIDVIRGDFDPS
jgi:hypothetical protein